MPIFESQVLDVLPIDDGGFHMIRALLIPAVATVAISFAGIALAGTTHSVGCAGGRAVVAEHGYRHVRPIECKGQFFTYLGNRLGHEYRITVNSRIGHISKVHQV
jgi:hypothetical protein